MHVASDKDPRMKRSGLHTLWLNRRICICTHTPYHRASLMAQQRMGNVKNLPTVQETQVWSRGREDPLEEAIATHSRILAGENPMDRGAWWATVQEVTESQTWPKRPSTYLTTVLVSLKNENGSTWIEAVFYVDERILHWPSQNPYEDEP